MKLTATVVLALSAVVCTYAQSSGNLAATATTAKCDINAKGQLVPGSTNTALKTTIQTPNAGSTALVIRPSLVTGLYTKTTVTKLSPDSTASAGIQVRVLLDNNVVAPGSNYGKPAGPEDGWIYYDKRYQQLSTNIFTAIENDTTYCTDPADPTVQEPCYISLVQSTLSAHSFDFVAGNVGQGTHTVEVQWRFDPVATGTDNEAACVGQSVVTVQQAKTFSTGSGIVIQ